MKRKKIFGFTLLEVTIALIIVGIITALTIPRFKRALERNRTMEATSNLMALLGSQKRHQMDTGNYSNSIGDLDVVIPASDYYLAPLLSTNPANLAKIARNGGNYGYSLTIDANGAISCTDSGTDDCNKIGY